MACSCGFEIEKLLRDPAYEEFRSSFDWKNPQSTGIITCNYCNTTVATGDRARLYQEEYKNRETQDLNREAERKAHSLAQWEAANPPRCQYCRDDRKAIHRPDLNSSDFQLSDDYSPEREALYVCKCGLVVGTECDAARQSSWVEYFFMK